MNEKSESPFRREFSLSPTQQRVAEVLARYSTPQYDLKSYYLGGLRVLEDEDNPDRVSQAANSFRELIEKLCMVTPLKLGAEVKPVKVVKTLKEKLKDCRAIYTGGWKGEINSALEDLLNVLTQYLEQPPSHNIHRLIELHDPMSHALPDRVLKDRRDTFQALGEMIQGATHHNREVEPDVLREKLILIEMLILNYFAPSTADHGRRLKELGAAPCNPEALKEAVRLSTICGANYKLFFDSLQDPSWLLPLFEIDYFKHPPITADDARAQFWVESACLARMYPKAPQVVIDIIKTLPPIKNVHVYSDISRVAEQISSLDHAEVMLVHLLEHIKNSGAFHGTDFSAILAHWAKIGAVDKALLLLKQIVTFYPDPKIEGKNKLSGMDRYMARIEPFIPFEAYEFSDILFGGARKVSAVAPSETAKLLIAALQEMLQLKDESAGLNEVSTYWCETLQEGVGHVETDRALVYATLYACEVVFTTKNDDLNEIHESLKEQKWIIFSRIRWFIYGKHVEKLLDSIRDDVLSEQFQYGGEDYEVEFAEMVRRAAEECGGRFLSSAEWNGIWGRITDGIAEQISQFSSKEGISEEKIAFRKKYLHCKFLRPFEPLLTQNQKAIFEVAREAAGEIVDNEKFSGSGWVVQKSPIESGELGKMSNSELAAYLNDWKPKGPYMPRGGLWEDVNVEGLAATFAELVKKDLKRFIKWPNWWKEIHQPIFMRRFLEVGTELVKSKDVMDQSTWDQLLMLCEWIAERTHKNDTAESVEKSDYQGEETAVLFFLREALEPGVNLPVTFRQPVFSLIKGLATQYDRNLDTGVYEKLNDLFYIAANSIRGKAISLLAAYGFWIRKNLSPEDKLVEIWTLLEDRLCVDTNEHPAVIASIVEQIMPWFLMNREWVIANRQLLFPEKPELWSAAWSAFLRRVHTSRDIFTIFKQEFVRGVKRVPRPKSGKNYGPSDDDLLGVYLVRLAWLGIIPVESGLLMEFYKKARVETRVEVARQSLMSINNATSISSEIILRIQEFVEWRLAQLFDPLKGAAYREANKSETKMFPRWFERELFPADWRLSQLLQYAEKVDSFNTAHFNINTLLPLLPSEVNRIDVIFLKLVQKSAPSKTLYWDIKDINALIESTIMNGKAEARDNVLEAKDILLKRGYGGFSES